MTSVEAEFVAHHLRLFGFPNATTDGNGAILVVNRPRLGDLHRFARRWQPGQQSWHSSHRLICYLP